MPEEQVLIESKLSDTTLTKTTPSTDTPAPECRWCGTALRSRRSGSAGRFCSARHRAAYWTACRRFGEQAVSLGVVSVAELKADSAACTLARKGGASSVCSTIDAVDQRAAEPLRRFAVEIPQGVLTALVFRYHEIDYSQQDDLVAVMAAFARLRREPRITKTPEGEKVLSYD